MRLLLRWGQACGTTASRGRVNIVTSILFQQICRLMRRGKDCQMFQSVLFLLSICELPFLQESYYSQATSFPISSFVSQLLYFRGKRCLTWPLQALWESQIHEDLSDAVYMVLTFGPSDDSPSTLRQAHLRRSCCSGSVFWIIRSSCPAEKPLSAVNLDGSASSFLTRPTGCS